MAPYFASGLVKLDPKSPEGRLVSRFRAELTAHVGGAPSATVRALIDRAGMLALRTALLDAKALQNGGLMSEHDSKQYLAWSNALGRALRDLGLKSAARAPRSLQDHIASRAPAA